MSFCENDTVLLSAFDTATQHGESDVRSATQVNSTNGHTVVSNIVTGLTCCEPDVMRSKDVLPVQAGSTQSSCTVEEVDSSQHKTAKDTGHCHAQNLADSSEYGTYKQCLTYPEVESVTCDKNVSSTVQPAAEADRTPSSAVSIQRKSAGRLSEKIKRTLQQNAKVDTPMRLNRLSAVVEKYDTIPAAVTDIGPFYGLPMKVKQLLESQRSITEFYRESLSYCYYTHFFVIEVVKIYFFWFIKFVTVVGSH